MSGPGRRRVTAWRRIAGSDWALDPRLKFTRCLLPDTDGWAPCRRTSAWPAPFWLRLWRPRGRGGVDGSDHRGKAIGQGARFQAWFTRGLVGHTRSACQFNVACSSRGRDHKDRVRLRMRPSCRLVQATWHPLAKRGAPGAIRTRNLRIRSPTLYPLSYGGETMRLPQTQKSRIWFRPGPSG